MTEHSVSVWNAVATGMWVAALLLEGGGTAVGLTTGVGAWTSMFMAWGLFMAVAAGTLTIKECTRRNRAVVAEAIRLVQRGESVAPLPRR